MHTFEELIQQASIRTGVGVDDLTAVLGDPTRLVVEPGGWLFHESSPRTWVGLVADGEVEIVRGAFGAEQLVARLGPGALVSEGFLLGDLPHATSARTRTGAVLWTVGADARERMRAERPEVFARLVTSIAANLSTRLRVAAEQLAAREREIALITGTRVEHDSLGTVEVPNHAYYGAQTVRALQNFPLSGVPLRQFGHLVDALANVKKAAAQANAELGALDGDVARAIVAACDEILGGALREHFVVDMFQGGAGTSTNMNANEVIANRAIELLGHRRGEYAHVHPNDHVNCSQSTNDVYPTAVKLAVIMAAKDADAALDGLQRALAAKGVELAEVLKMGRTEMQDAVPMTLGQEFEAYAVMVREAAAHIRREAEHLRAVSLGATAIGTGLNSPAGYAPLVTAKLSAATGLDLELAADLVEATQDSGEFVAVSAALKRAAVQLSKICNDLRLLSSGPRAGLGEINLPPMQPGSSIMPGKVNPVVPEVVSQVCFQLVGYDMTITMAAEASQLELNMAEPVIAFDLLHGLMLLKNVVVVLTTRCIDGITANVEVCRGYVERSIGLVTALNPIIGYERSVQIAHEAMETGKGVYELVIEKGWLAEEELDRVLAPEHMIHPRLAR